MSRSLMIDHNDNVYGGQLGTIQSTMLGYESHGILTAHVEVGWPGGGVSVGGFFLDTPRNRDARDSPRKGTAYGLDHIIRLMETVGVSKWEELVGQTVVVLSEGRAALGAQSVGIAHATDEKKVLVFSEHAEAWKNGAA